MILSPSAALRLAAIMSGVHPEPSCDGLGQPEASNAGCRSFRR